jgi:RNA polymerase primary sigma factor
MAHTHETQSLADQPLVTGHHSTAALSLGELKRLRIALAATPGYVDNDALHCPDAEVSIMIEPEAIERPDVSWYSPFMETVQPQANMPSPQQSAVLSREQEAVLFHQYNYARLRADQLREKHSRIALTARQSRALIRWHGIALSRREQLAESNLPLVLAMAKRSHPRSGDYGDLIAEGNMALLRAIDKFDVDRGFKFSTYACQAILKSFSRWGMKQTRYRDRFPARFDPSMERSDWPAGRAVTEARESADEVRHVVLHNTAHLSDVEQQVLHHRFGIGKAQPGCPDGGPMTLVQVGRTIGLTKERVRKVQNKALLKLRDVVLVN